MTRVYHTYQIEDVKLIKQQMLSWACHFNVCCFLDNCGYQPKYHSFECIVGVGSKKVLSPGESSFAGLSSFIETNNDWVFGHFNYETGSKPEKKVYTKEQTKPSFPGCFLFVPEIVIRLENHNLTIGVLDKSADAVFSAIQQQDPLSGNSTTIQFKERISRTEYLDIVTTLKQHIQQGDCYEINFCQEFYATAKIDPVAVFNALITASPNPFCSFYRVGEDYLLCASPERYLKKIGDKLISQPIKGTAARNWFNTEEDNKNRKSLGESVKDRSENVMIVDLVRNDLSKICAEGSVVVEELFGVYTFPHVYQMMSTITGTIELGKTFADVLQATFPMGSMTGAPKKKVMELINKYEQGKRGIYSGAVGYITPEKDFDLNVVIRSLVYNERTSYLSFHTGSAITASSNAENEYDECLLKGRAIRKIFSAEFNQNLRS